MNGTTTVQLAEKTAKAVTGSVEEWTGFLQSAARLYKYSYPEQLLIYAQRPDATACASYEIWNQTMRRYVRRGARGIALPDGAGAVRYVFDVADTGARKSSREVKTWVLDENNREAVAHALETQYGSAAKLGIAGQLEEIAMQQSMDYWQWHQDELRGIVDGSFLEGYDELNLEIAFRNTAAASVKYMLLSRCNLAREYQIEPEELAGVLEWNTSAASGALGSAGSELSEGVLREIERTIRQYERSQNYDERTDVYEERRVLDSRSDSSRTVGDTEQIRTDAGMVSEGASDDHLQQPAPERKIDRAPDGDRSGGGESDGENHAGAGEAGGRDRSAESNQPDVLGRADEHLQGAGRRNRNERADLRLNRQMSLFPTEAEQIQSLEEADEREVSASFLMEKATDVVLDKKKKQLSMNIATAYPDNAEVEKWIRTYRLKDRSLDISDDFILKGLQNENQVNFLLWGDIDLGTTGRVKISVKGQTVELHYDSSLFIPSLETILLTDPRLSNVWGEKIFRLSLIAKKMAEKGHYLFSVKAL